MMRLDKFLAHVGLGTRKEVKQLIRNRRVEVNGVVVRSDDLKVDELHDVVCVDGQSFGYKKQVYLMMNKPKGYVCANEDLYDPTVFDLFDHFEGLNLFTIGRLDKDTTGLLIITNDGDYAHRMISPKKHVDKEYIAVLSHQFDEAYIPKIEEGIWINDQEQCAPAYLDILEDKKVRLIIQEGKFHQVKRMLHACDNEVIELHRKRIGSLILDESLDYGEYREMTQEEILLAIDSINE